MVGPSSFGKPRFGPLLVLNCGETYAKARDWRMAVGRPDPRFSVRRWWCRRNRNASDRDRPHTTIGRRYIHGASLRLVRDRYDDLGRHPEWIIGYRNSGRKD